MRHVKVLSAALAVVAAYASGAYAGSITAGNPVVLVQDTIDPNGTPLGTSATTPRGSGIDLVEYNGSTGAEVQRFQASRGGADAIALEQSLQEGVISTTPDKSKIIFGGYRYTPFTIPSSTATVPTGTLTSRVGGYLTTAGVLNTSFTTTIGGSIAGNVNSTASVDGSSFYFGTTSQLGTGPQGLAYAATSGSPAATISLTRSRAVVLANINGTANTLVGSDGLSSPANVRVNTYGAAPTSLTTGTALYSSATGDVVQGMSFVDLSPLIPGDDTLYLVQNGYSGSATTGTNPGIQKWTFNGTSWSFSGSVAHLATTSTSTIFNNVAAYPTGAGVQLFATSDYGLYSLVDSTGYGGTLAVGTSPVTTLQSLTPGGKYRMRGVAVVPEPASIGALSLIGLAALRRRTRQ